ncbi:MULTISPECIES: hypothetical protein [unclassified Rhodococcus (in: high G+C Gram-positive bacteria)]|uniref:hypothetical protein n=1 Tax=unclassified Rhodococcus (in: high G+C Gram-positive bacteria) TaxID=192944 RepID=UPI0016397372|nr:MULTISPECIES: hypothetical protein [unclassified Rhodococcus (in: high G+C Gram-positive bacteria)]MBC2642736.1 hypothetical protein [Rhodococcus sp. 3A]MBC2892522.1 hypothetical protein [Rhodococcus sp. 4CII]
MTANPAEFHGTPSVSRPSTPAAPDETRRLVAYTKPILKMFPPTSEQAAKVTMLTVYALMVIAIIFIVLREFGAFS